MRDYLDPTFFERSSHSPTNGSKESLESSNNGNSPVKDKDVNTSYRPRSKANYTYYYKGSQPTTIERNESCHSGKISKSKKKRK